MEGSISLRGVRQNNLKNLDLDIPLGALTVITGVSGSGKSSLAFETLYAEGSRRYMESLSTYARQFLDKLPKPEVDEIKNVPPAIALEQRNSVTNNRTTVAMITEIYDYLRLFFAAIGHQNCKACGHPEVTQVDTNDIAKRILALPIGTKLYLLCRLDFLKNEPKEKKGKKKEAKTSSTFDGQELYRLGFQRILVDDQVIDLSSAEGQIFLSEEKKSYLLVERLVVTENLRQDSSRLLESIENALFHGNGTLFVQSPDKSIFFKASTGYACTNCGEIHSPPYPTLFSSNSPLGACSVCSGFGENLTLNPDLIIPSPEKTLRDGAVDPLAKPSNADWQKEMFRAMEKRGVGLSTRYKELKKVDRDYLWNGDDSFPGINGYFEMMAKWKYKLHIRVFIRRYQALVTCASCKGSRLSEYPLRFHVGKENSKNIADVLDMTIEDALEWFQTCKLSAQEMKKSKEVIRQIVDRLSFLQLVGVGYVRLNRKANSLSGGEYQRISLAAQLGSKLSNTLYVLDEPSIGLHPSDTDKLIQVITTLRDHGNTVVVVEHDMSILQTADFLVEIGPQAGSSGGKITAQGLRKDFLKNKNSLTAKYLSGEMRLPNPLARRPGNGKILSLQNCSEHNLKNVTLNLPLGSLIAITGLSGSGKSTLIEQTLYKALARLLLREPIPNHEIGKFENIKGFESLNSVLLLDQTPMGRSSRSNPATYMKMYDEIRKIMAAQTSSARKSLTPADFSFNVDGGRCPTCSGDGFVEVDMHFLAAMRLVCEDCQGKRFKKHVLEVTYREKNIYEILHTTIADAKNLFADNKTILSKCELLDQVGLGYLQLGQSVNSLSGGECQRLKIASTLDEQRGTKNATLYIFDEPTTGLHLHDIRKLIEIFQNLVEAGNTVLFIEHNIDLIQQADWVIDLGPGGGDRGGEIVAEGTPEQLMKKTSGSLTGKYLADRFANKNAH